MIRYSYTGLCTLFHCAGSVFPSCMLKALPSTCIAGALQKAFPHSTLSMFGEDGGILTEAQVWAAFTFLVSFLIVFRTSQAYSRWWEGCTACQHMRAEWFDASSAVVSFCKHSQADPHLVDSFKGLLVRLISMMHALASAHIETGGEDEDMIHRYQLISPDDLDAESLRTLLESECKVELVFTWVQQHIVENISNGVLSIPAPLLSRAFQEYANGMVHYYTAMHISLTPFPFAYAQTCDCLLLLHWAIVPMITSQWATHWVWAALFTFVQVFVVQTLNKIATELENPFGVDANDVDGAGMQHEMNRHLRMLASKKTARTPVLKTNVTRAVEARHSRTLKSWLAAQSDARHSRALKSWLSGQNAISVAVAEEDEWNADDSDLGAMEEAGSEAGQDDSFELQLPQAAPVQEQPRTGSKHVVLDQTWAPEAFAHKLAEADTLASSPVVEGEGQEQTGRSANSDRSVENGGEPPTREETAFSIRPRVRNDSTASKSAPKHGSPRHGDQHASGESAKETLMPPARHHHRVELNCCRDFMPGRSQSDEPKLSSHAPNGASAR